MCTCYFPSSCFFFYFILYCFPSAFCYKHIEKYCICIFFLFTATAVRPVLVLVLVPVTAAVTVPVPVPVHHRTCCSAHQPDSRSGQCVLL